MEAMTTESDLAKAVADYLSAPETEAERKLQHQLAQRPKRRVVPVTWDAGSARGIAPPERPAYRAAG
jgi:hypothetical protein